MLCLPEYHSAEAFKRFGPVKLGFLVTSVIDSMVNHYTAARKRRNTDAPGGRASARPRRDGLLQPHP